MLELTLTVDILYSIKPDIRLLAVVRVMCSIYGIVTDLSICENTLISIVCRVQTISRTMVQFSLIDFIFMSLCFEMIILMRLSRLLRAHVAHI